MNLRLVILSVACLSCLTPAALGVNLLTKAAVVKGGALLAKGAILKGLLVKGAVAKGALLVNGAYKPKPILVASKPVAFVSQPYAVVSSPVPPQFPAILGGHLSALWSVLKSSVAQKASGVLELASSLFKVKTPPPVVYQTIQTQYPVPVVEKVVVG